MAEFLNGTTSSNADGNTVYNGVSFANIPELLAHFRDSMAAAGWTIILDDIATNYSLKMKGSDNGDECFINFSATEISSSTFDLTIQGDVDGTGRTKNIDDSEVSITQRVKANLGRLYVTASARSFAFISVEKAFPSIPYYGGFPQRENLADSGAWGYGSLHWKMTDKYFAQTDPIPGDWRELKEFYYNNNEVTIPSTSMQGCYEGTMDRNTVNLFGASSSLSASQSAYRPELGSLDQSGKAKISNYFLKRGAYLQGQYVNVSEEVTPAILYGDIDFAVVGLASLYGGDQVTVDTEECGTYYRRTYISGDPTYQGFQISEESQDTPFT